MLGSDLAAAASGIIRLLEQNLLHALQQISIQRGYDPREFTLVASGGAGPMHGASVGRMLGCRAVYIPRLSGVFCALGMLHTDLRLDFVRTRYGRLDDVSGEELETIFAELEVEAGSQLEASGAPRVECAREMDLRYTGQSWDVRIPVNSADKTQIRQRFELEYDRLFGHIQPDGILEMTALRVVGAGILPRAQAAHADRSGTPPVPVERRSVYLEDGRVEIDVFEGADLRPGQKVTGPALISEHTTTVLIELGDRLEVDGANNFMIHLGGTDV